MELGAVGVWWSMSWRPAGAASGAAGEIEQLGYGALWSSGGFDPGLSPHFERLLGSTRRSVVASGIVSIWTAAPEDLASATTGLEARYPGRFLLGLGASHAPIVEGYAKPYRRMVEYLDALDGLDAPVHRDRRVLAALGPRMLELAADRALGAHPYLVPVEHTERARQIMGAGPLLAPEMTAVLEPDPKKGRERARAFLRGYLALPNYADNLRSLGFSDDDLSGDGSDRLVDAVVAHGGADALTARVLEHREAGADHVALQLVTAGDGFPLDEYRTVAAALFPSPKG
jgi:probable F420-dependent oxidoreductase